MKSNVSSNSEYHLFEADRSSGILVFTVDNNDPVQLKFFENIRVQVIFDNPIDSSEKNGLDTCEQSNVIVTDDPQLQHNSDQIQKHGSSSLEEDHPEIKSKFNEDSYFVNSNREQSLPASTISVQEVEQNAESSQYAKEVSFNEISQDDEESQNFDMECDINAHVTTETYSEHISASGDQKSKNKEESRLLQQSSNEQNVNKNEDTLNDLKQYHPRRSGRLHQRGKVVSKGKKYAKEARISQGGNILMTKEEVKRTKRGKCGKNRDQIKHDDDKKKYKCQKKKEISQNPPQKQEVFICKAIEDEKDITSVASNKEQDKIMAENYAQKNLDEEQSINQVSNKESIAEDSDQVKSSCKSKRDSRPRKLLMQKDVRCIYCEVTFDTKLDFFNHRRIKGSCFACKICGKEEPFEALLMVHMQTHKPQKGHVQEEDNERSKHLVRKRNKMKCDVCGLVVSSLDSLKIHMMLHTGEYPYKCCVCDSRFFSLSSLRHHLIVHLSSERVHCKQCDMGFATRAELGKHQLTHELKCGLCGETFPNKTSRNCHYRVSHSNEILKCTECYSLFSTESELQKHMIYHRNSKKEQCPECGLVVAKLKEHMTLHSRKNGEKMFACQQCSMRYMSKAMLDKHLLSHTGERPYACNKCTKRFRNNGMLRKHLLTHTLERPFVCEVCGKRFSVRSNLVTHMKIHSDTRQYPCTYCSQAFNYKNSLKVHLKAKHGNQNQAQYKCLHCEQQFKDNALLTSHIFSDHTELKVIEKDTISQPPTTSNQHGQSQIPMEVSSLFISDHLQAFYNGLESNHQNAMHLNNSLDLSLIETASGLLNRGPMLNALTLTSASNFDSTARDEMMNFLNKDRSSPFGHPPAIISMPPSLHLLPSENLDLPPSDSFNTPLSCHSLSPSHDLIEADSPLDTKTLDAASSLDENGQLYPLYHTL